MTRGLYSPFWISWTRQALSALSWRLSRSRKKNSLISWEKYVERNHTGHGEFFFQFWREITPLQCSQVLGAEELIKDKIATVYWSLKACKTPTFSVFVQHWVLPPPVKPFIFECVHHETKSPNCIQHVHIGNLTSGMGWVIQNTGGRLTKALPRAQGGWALASWKRSHFVFSEYSLQQAPMGALTHNSPGGFSALALSTNGKSAFSVGTKCSKIHLYVRA